MKSNRGAILLGIENYESKDFDNLSVVKNDLASIEEALLNHNYRTISILDENHNLEINSKQEVLDFTVSSLENEVLKNVDTLIVYFSGHGINHEGRDYIIFGDGGAPGSSGHINGNLELDKFSELILNTHDASTIIFILDACRNNVNNIPGYNKKWVSSTSFCRKTESQIIFGLVACGENEYAYFGDGIRYSQKPNSFFTKAVCDYLLSPELKKLDIQTFYSKIVEQIQIVLRDRGKENIQQPKIIYEKSEIGVRELSAIDVRNKFPNSLNSPFPKLKRGELSKFLELLTSNKNEHYGPAYITDIQLGVCMILETLGLIKVRKGDKPEEYIIDRSWLITSKKIDDYFMKSLARAIKDKVKTNIDWNSPLATSRNLRSMERKVSGSELVHTYQEAIVNQINEKQEDIKEKYVVKILIPIKYKKSGLKIVTELYGTIGSYVLPVMKLDYKSSKKAFIDPLTQMFGASIVSVLDKRLEPFNDYSPNTGMYTRYYVRILIPKFDSKPKSGDYKIIPFKNIKNGGESKFREGFIKEILPLIEKHISYEEQ